MTEGASPDPSTQTQPRDLSGDLDQEDVSQASATASATAPVGITLTQEQFQQLLATATSSSPAKTTKPLVTPRVGGLTANHGVWTGHGRNEEHLEPVSLYCYRKFIYDDLKSLQAISKNEEQCKQGLRTISTVLFCRDTEEHGGKGAMVLKELEQYLMNHGLEGVFQIQIADETVDMLKTPGLVTEAMVKTWLTDLTVDGVHDSSQHRRHPVCPYDKINLQLSAEAILNSCSDTLRQDLLNTIAPKDRYGPWILLEVLKKVYKPDLNKLRDIVKQIEALSITKMDAQNVTEFKLICGGLVREAQMNFTSADPVPDLAIKALLGLTSSTCPDFRAIVVKTLRELSQPGNQDAKSAIKTLDLLDVMEHEYLTLKNMGLYPPAKKPTSEETKYKAMQAKVSYLEKEMTKLSQDRTAASSTGNSNKKKVPAHIKCHICGGNHYANQHHKFANSGSSSNSTASTDGSSTGSSTNSSGGSSSNGSNSKRGVPTHGLSDEVNKKCNELIKEKLKSMPSREQIPDDTQYCIEVDGKTVAKYCRHCGRFSKGSSQHFTSEHKGQRKFPYKGSSAGESKKAAGLHAAPKGAGAGLVCFGPATSYDFNAMAPPSAIKKGAAKLASASPPRSVQEDNVDSGSLSDESDDPPGFMDVLNARTSPKEYGR